MYVGNSLQVQHGLYFGGTLIYCLIRNLVKIITKDADKICEVWDSALVEFSALRGLRTIWWYLCRYPQYGRIGRRTRPLQVFPFSYVTNSALGAISELSTCCCRLHSLGILSFLRHLPQEYEVAESGALQPHLLCLTDFFITIRRPKPHYCNPS